MCRKRSFSPARLEMAAWGIIGLALCIGLITRPIFLFWRDIDFSSGDESRDAYEYIAMRSGSWPVLGPITTGDAWHLPPLYYYLVFPFALLGHDLRFQALSSAVFSLLTIPLIIYVLYRFLTDVPHERRLFWAGVGGLWWSLLVTDIILGTRPWNPSPLPFFLLSFVVVAASLLERRVYDKKELLLWVLLGFLFAVLVSLHATAFYVMPIVFAGIALTYVWRSAARSAAIVLVLLALITAMSCLIPYWIGEGQNHWENTKSVLQFSLHMEAEKTLSRKAELVFQAYAWLDGLEYFITDQKWIRLGGLGFLLFIIPTTFLSFRGNRAMLRIFAYIWIIFLCAAASYQADEVRYRLLIAMAPIFLTISCLSGLTYASLRDRLIGMFLIVGILVSMATNVLAEVRHETYRFGPARLIALSDVIDAFHLVPYGAGMCDMNRSDQYIDEYMTRRKLRFSSSCVSGDYEIIPKFVAQGWSGSDTVNNYQDGFLGYLTLPQTVPGPPIPPGARIIMQNDSVDLVVVGSTLYPPARLWQH